MPGATHTLLAMSTAGAKTSVSNANPNKESGFLDKWFSRWSRKYTR